MATTAPPTRLGLDAAANDPELKDKIRTTQEEVIADEQKRTREEPEGPGEPPEG